MCSVLNIGQYDFAVKSLFEFLVVFLNKSEQLQFIYVTKMLSSANRSRNRLAAKTLCDSFKIRQKETQTVGFSSFFFFIYLFFFLKLDQIF